MKYTSIVVLIFCKISLASPLLHSSGFVNCFTGENQGIRDQGCSQFDYDDDKDVDLTDYFYWKQEESKKISSFCPNIPSNIADNLETIAAAGVQAGKTKSQIILDVSRWARAQNPRVGYGPCSRCSPP